MNGTPISDSGGDDFEVIVRQHHRRLLAYTRGLCGNAEQAEDLAQEAFVIAYRRRDDFDPDRGPMGAWLRGIARMRYLNLVSRRRELPLDNEILEAYEIQHREWDAAGSDHELLDALHDCLRRLGAPMRRAIELFYFECLSGAAVAEVTAAKPATVRKRLQQGRDLLRRCIDAKLRS